MSRLFRSMKSSVDGKNLIPCCGGTARELGVRIGVDISVDAQQNVHPQSGGMSASISPFSLPKHRRPPELNGIGKDPVFSISILNISNYELAFRIDNRKSSHALIEPERTMNIESFNKNLCQSKPDWEQYFHE